ncbi:radical SAM protein [Candidatus Woesearchaeota archaeon]|nr:radical SAM protein [Candidatus Woesearchaeota archaeon]
MNELESIFSSASERANEEIQTIDLDVINNLRVKITKIEGDQVFTEGISKTHEDLLGSHTVVTYPPLDALREIDPSYYGDFFRGIKLGGEIDLYIHIPFCDYSCTFCGYTTLNTRTGGSTISKYIDALKKEVRTWSTKFRDGKSKVRSLYIGGGTPFVLSPDTLEDLLLFVKQELPFTESPSICIETSPKMMKAEDNKEKLDMLVNNGLTRISIGIQTFDYETLRRIGRHFRGHTIDDEENAARTLMNFAPHVNVDMMQDLPVYTTPNLERLKFDLLKIAELKPHHVTWYNMRLRPERRKDYNVAEERESLLARLIIWNFMEEIGYTILEADRFGLNENFEDSFRKTRGSVQTSLLGLGVSSYSHIGDIFFQNSRMIGESSRENSSAAIAEYLKAVEENGYAFKHAFDLTPEEILAGRFALGLKKGFDVDKLVTDFCFTPTADVYYTYTNPLVPQLVENGLVEVEGSNVRITRKGRLWENEICSLYYTPRVVKLAAERRGELTPAQLRVWRWYEGQIAAKKTMSEQKNIINW